METEPKLDPVLLRGAFEEHEQPVRVRNYKVGCLLAFIFMPAGASLDYFVYRDFHGRHLVLPFFAARLVCSALLATVGLVLHFKPHVRNYRLLGLSVALLPLFFISGMIYWTEGAASPYYAGLNLVMLGAAILLRWTLLDSIIVFLLVLAAWLGASLL